MDTLRMENADYAKIIGDALDKAMGGMSQSALSRLSGVSQPTISRTLSGNTIPETPTLIKLVAVLNSEDLRAAVANIIPAATKATISPLVTKFFPLPCKSCKHVTHESFVEIETHDEITCPACGAAINVADYYGRAVLEKFIESIGLPFALRNRD